MLKMDDVRKLNIKAVIIGWLVDTVGTFIAGIFIGIIAGILFTAKGIPPEQLEAELAASKAFLNLLLFVGFSLTFIGAYTAAFIAKTDEIKHALMVGILSLVTGLLFTAIASPAGPSPFLISLFVIPFAVLGGYLRKTTKKRAEK